MTATREILNKHTQHYQNSCAASAMEMILKLHELEAPEFRTLQDRYRDENIGFGRLGDLAAYNIEADDHELLTADGFRRIQEEVDAGRFPLVSLPSNDCQWHIWVVVPGPNGIHFLSRTYLDPNILEQDDTPEFRQFIAQARNGKIHFAVYDFRIPLR